MGEPKTVTDCRLHRSEWYLYGGFNRPFVFCATCNKTYGHKDQWDIHTGVPYSNADVELQEAADEQVAFGVRPDVAEEMEGWDQVLMPAENWWRRFTEWLQEVTTHE